MIFGYDDVSPVKEEAEPMVVVFVRVKFWGGRRKLVSRSHQLHLAHFVFVQKLLYVDWKTENARQGRAFLWKVEEGDSHNDNCYADRRCFAAVAWIVQVVQPEARAYKRT